MIAQRPLSHSARAPQPKPHATRAAICETPHIVSRSMKKDLERGVNTIHRLRSQVETSLQEVDCETPSPRQFYCVCDFTLHFFLVQYFWFSATTSCFHVCGTASAFVHVNMMTFYTTAPLVCYWLTRVALSQMQHYTLFAAVQLVYFAHLCGLFVVQFTSSRIHIVFL